MQNNASTPICGKPNPQAQRSRKQRRCKRCGKLKQYPNPIFLPTKETRK